MNQASPSTDKEQALPKPASMEELLQQEQTEGYRSLRRGDVVEGVIVRADREGILVDVGTKSEGIVLSQEVQSLLAGREPLKVGDQVLVFVVQSEDAEGRILLSLDRARTERGWRVIQRQFEAGEVIEGDVVEHNRGGVIVSVGGVRGFVPASQVAGIRPGGEGEPEQQLAGLIGKKLRLKIIELDRRNNRFILSERAAVQEWRTQQKDRLLGELQVGAIRRGVVSSITSFGVFVDLGGADGLIHLSELSWQRIRSPHDVVKVGDEVDVCVMNIDLETRRIALSLRRAQPEPWGQVATKYQEGQIVRATITKLATFGAFARLEGGIEGLIHVSELDNRRIAHPKEVVREGQLVQVKIVRFEPEKRRVGLSLKQARAELGDDALKPSE